MNNFSTPISAFRKEVSYMTMRFGVSNKSNVCGYSNQIDNVVIVILFCTFSLDSCTLPLPIIVCTFLPFVLHFYMVVVLWFSVYFVTYHLMLINA